jgi:hypothetical protein
MSIVAVLKPAADPVPEPAPKAKVDKPIVKVAPSKEDRVSRVEPPASIYERINKKPYLVDALNLENWELLQGEFDTEGIRDKVARVEKYILGRIKDRKLEDTLDSYRQILERFYGELSIGKNLKREEKLDRLDKWVGLLKKQEALDKRRDDIIKGLIN